jgi:uncharacterized membrane protein SirB2
MPKRIPSGSRIQMEMRGAEVIQSQDFAAQLGAAIYIGVAAFQVAVAAGAPLGEFTQGGQSTGRLPRSGRIVAAASALALLLMAGTLLAVVGIGPLAALDSTWIGGLWLATSAYAILGVILNFATRSTKERRVFFPVSLVLLICVALVALR